MKGTAEFDSVEKFTPVGERQMAKVEDGTAFLWVRAEDYERLLRELRFERKRLKRAGELVNSLIVD